MTNTEPNVIKTLRLGKESHSIVRYKKQAIDAFSASAIIAVYDALTKEEVKTKLATIAEKNMLAAATIAFKMCK